MKNKETRKKVKKALDDAREIFRVTALEIGKEDWEDFYKNEDFDPADEALKAEFYLLSHINHAGYIKEFSDMLRRSADLLDKKVQECLEKYLEDRKNSLKAK
jgi:hypothetical protein